jgi:hypothetical protein
MKWRNQSQQVTRLLISMLASWYQAEQVGPRIGRSSLLGCRWTPQGPSVWDLADQHTSSAASTSQSRAGTRWRVTFF